MNGLVTELDGTKHWYKNGELHREDGPAIIQEDGTKCWYINGKYHRDGGPAIELADGTKVWYKNGLQHRDDGPAIEYADGALEYWWFDKELSYEYWLEKRFWLKVSDGVINE